MESQYFTVPPVSEPSAKSQLFLEISSFPVVSRLRSALKGCAGPFGPSPKRELRVGCHHLCSFSVHSCWGTIHQANRLEEGKWLLELPTGNK